MNKVFDKELQTFATKAGYIAVVGRPNTGKSTLINQLAQEKKVMTSKRAQTTLFNTTCVITFERYLMQCVFVDTPGINFENQHSVAKSIHKQALQALKAIDLKLWLIEAHRWQPHDEQIAKLLEGQQEQTLVIVNKIDKLASKEHLLPVMAKLANLGFKHVLPHRANSFQEQKTLLDSLSQLLPQSPYIFSDDKTLVSYDFQIREVVREKCLRYLGQELPYKCVFVVEQATLKNKVLHAYVRIDCASLNHKKIIIGSNGQLLKQIATASRHSLEKILKRKLFLKVWVKVTCERSLVQTLSHQLKGSLES